MWDIKRIHYEASEGNAGFLRMKIDHLECREHGITKYGRHSLTLLL